MKPKKWDGLILLCIAAFLMIFVLELKNTNEQARVYPTVLLICSYVLLAYGLVRWFIAFRRGDFKDEAGMPLPRTIYMFVYCAAILLYIFLIDKLGYIVSTVLFGIYSLVYMKNKNKIVIIVLPIVTALLMYYIFRNFLFVRLPKGILKF